MVDIRKRKRFILLVYLISSVVATTTSTTYKQLVINPSGSGSGISGSVFGVAAASSGIISGKPPKVPCFFIFGDSLSDSGNNNRLNTLARANFLPYGVDFPGGPTGRFTNGRTTVDLIGEYLGLDAYIPPFSSDQSGEEVLKGINYASGSSGILNETGAGVGGRTPMDEQLENHRSTISKITTNLLGNHNKVEDHLRQCLYSVYAGSNDYMLNYFMTQTAYSLIGVAQLDKTPAQFTNSLVSRYAQQLQKLYEYGARKVVVFGLGPLGCLPMLNLSGGCSETINKALQLFNTKVSGLVDDFNKKLPDANFIIVDTMKIVSPDLSALGLRVTNVPCCGVGRQIFCLPLSLPCSDRDSYAFWDNAHPTEAANKVLATRAYKAQGPDDAHPTDISQLVGDTDHSDTSGHGGASGNNANNDRDNGNNTTGDGWKRWTSHRLLVLILCLILGRLLLP